MLYLIYHFGKAVVSFSDYTVMVYNLFIENMYQTLFSALCLLNIPTATVPS